MANLTRVGTTSFDEIYDKFFGKITDDMYMEWTKEDTQNDIFNILMDAIPGFEFPRFNLYNYTVIACSNRDEQTGDWREYSAGHYNCKLTPEEINIIALLMVNTWLQRQLASIEQTRMKYSGSDFKMTSQANHLAKLLELRKETERQSFHMQRLYKRRKQNTDDGEIQSNWSSIMEKSVFDG